MTCEHCLGADEIFDEKGAKKNLKKYRKKGLTGASKHLFEGIKAHSNGSLTVLDIGGGIGGIHLELIKMGFQKATDVDASSGYIKMAKDESQRQDQQDKVSYFFGDFVDHHTQLENHDVVVMDKVVCCYPHFNDLLTNAMDKSNEILALSYPKSNLPGRLLVSLGNFFFKFKGSKFRAFMHPNAEIRAVIKSGGFERLYYKSTIPWNIEVYRKRKLVDR